jgi:hypothetical protein
VVLTNYLPFCNGCCDFSRLLRALWMGHLEHCSTNRCLLIHTVRGLHDVPSGTGAIEAGLAIPYIVLSNGGFGGALGGMLVALLVPHVFPAFWEYQLGLWTSACLLLVVLARDKGSWLYRSRFGLPGVAVVAALLPGCVSVVMLGKKEIVSLFPVLLVLVAVYFLTRGSEKGVNSARGAGGATLLWGGIACARSSASFQRENSKCHCPIAKLLRSAHCQGTELGSTRLASLFPLPWPNCPPVPVPVGIKAQVADRLLRRDQWRGLGPGRTPDTFIARRDPKKSSARYCGFRAGTLAAYGRAGDYVRFYEINPEVTRIASDTRYFTYLKDCPARLDVIPGDARLSMESELNRGQPQDFDLLAIDAFSGDAIPVHLLTEEAFQI